MGARDVEMAKPWRREIYLEHRAFPHGSLRHEIAHAVAGEFGDPIVRRRRDARAAVPGVSGLPCFNPGLIEGLAVARRLAGRLRPADAARVRCARCRRWASAVDRGAVVAASSSACRRPARLHDRGLVPASSCSTATARRRCARCTTSGGDFDAAYGKPLDALEREWLAMTSTIVLPTRAVEAHRGAVPRGERVRATVSRTRSPRGARRGAGGDRRW